MHERRVLALGRNHTLESWRGLVALAQQLMLAGFAVVRFDERGTGQSTGDYTRSATTASLADDVQALVVAGREPKVAAVALMSAPAWTGRRIMSWQDDYAVKHGEWSSARQAEESRLAWLEGERQRRESADAWFPFFLILHGEGDVHVTRDQALELARAAREAGHPGVALQVFSGLSHSLGDPALGPFPQPLSASVGATLAEPFTPPPPAARSQPIG